MSFIFRRVVCDIFGRFLERRGRGTRTAHSRAGSQVASNAADSSREVASGRGGGDEEVVFLILVRGPDRRSFQQLRYLQQMRTTNEPF